MNSGVLKPLTLPPPRPWHLTTAQVAEKLGIFRAGTPCQEAQQRSCDLAHKTKPNATGLHRSVLSVPSLQSNSRKPCAQGVSPDFKPGTDSSSSDMCACGNGEGPAPAVLLIPALSGAQCSSGQGHKISAQASALKPVFRKLGPRQGPLPCTAPAKVQGKQPKGSKNGRISKAATSKLPKSSDEGCTLATLPAGQLKSLLPDGQNKGPTKAGPKTIQKGAERTADAQPTCPKVDTSTGNPGEWRD